MTVGKSARDQGAHPVIRRFVGGTDTLLEVLAAQPEPREPVVAAMFELRKAYNQGNDERMRAIGQVEAVVLKDVEPNLAALFLCVWAELSHRLGRRDEAAALLRRARALLGTVAFPEIEAMILAGDAATFSSQGKKTEAESCLRRTLKIMPPDAPRRPILVISLARFLAHLGRETEVEEEVARVAGDGSAAWAAEVPYLRFIQLVETCRLSEAREFEPGVDLGPERLAAFQRNFEAYRSLVAFLTEVAGGQGRGDVRPEEGYPVGGILAALLNRAPGEALRLARLQEEKVPGYAVISANFLSFNLLRAELACGHAEAARRIMALRRGLGNVHYLDHFFAARVDLLSGDFDSAARRFAAARRLCARYRAEARLEFELRLACELTPDAVMRLTLAAAAVKEAAPEIAPPAGAGAPVRLVGASPAMEALRASVGRMAPLDSPVLVTGETGTGKDLVARALHEESPRKGLPFIAVNCGAIAESLLESELFGHARGAFTGAEREHRGIFEEAGAGTVLLDEIGEMPPRLQAALLRVLESGEIRPVGASRPRRVKCRIVAATNADLPAMVASGRFRQDLFYRLERLEIAVPPLRERGRDALELAGHFLGQDRRDGRRPEMSEDLRRALLARRWPGNVRELRNVVERMRLMNSDKLSYDLADLEPGAAHPEPTAPSEPGPTPARDTGQGPPERALLGRLRRLRELFAERGRLRHVEIVRLLGASSPTVTRDLQTLCAEGLIEKVTPNRSPRTHYFRLRSPSP